MLLYLARTSIQAACAVVITALANYKSQILLYSVPRSLRCYLYIRRCANELHVHQDLFFFPRHLLKFSQFVAIVTNGQVSHALDLLFLLNPATANAIAAGAEEHTFFLTKKTHMCELLPPCHVFKKISKSEHRVRLVSFLQSENQFTTRETSPVSK